MEACFRGEYNELPQENKDTVRLIKEKASELLNVITYGEEMSFSDDESRPHPTRNKGSRECSLAVTKLEEAVMWAVKHWTA